MPGQIGATAYLGISHETTYGTYVAPTRFFPIKSCSLKQVWAHRPRRVIRGIADNLGYVAGNNHVEGDIVMELMPDVLPYFLYVMRCSVVKTGAGPYQYVTTPVHIGDARSLPGTPKGMSIVLYRGGEVNAFLGCVVSQLKITIEEGIPILTLSIIGSSEVDQADPTPTFIATDLPISAGGFNFQLPTASTVLTVENMTFTVNENAQPQFRLNNTGAAQWVKFGERSVNLEVTRDYEDRVEWDLFKALTATTCTVVLTQGTRSITIKMDNVVRETYEIGDVSDQGSVILASVNYVGNYNAGTSKSYELTIAGSTTNIT